MKKLSALFFGMVMILTFSSCSYGETELKNRLIIEGIGIDYDEKEDMYDLTVQVLVTSGGGSDEAPENPAVNYSVKGKTIAEAVGSLSDTTGKNPLYSQNRIIVAGSSLTREKIVEALDYFIREYTARADVLMAAAAGDAKDIISNSDGSSDITAKVIEGAIKESSINSKCLSTELYNMVNLYNEETTTFTMPLLEVTSDRNLDEKTVKVTGTKVFSSEENSMSDMETMFFLFVSDKVQSGTFSVETQDGAGALDIIKSKTKTKVSVKDNMPFYETEVKCTVDLVEYDGTRFGNIEKSDILKIQKAAESYIEEGMKEVISRQLKEEKSDIFRFGRMFMKAQPELYGKLSENWSEILPEIGFSVDVQVTVRRIGQETLKA